MKLDTDLITDEEVDEFDCLNTGELQTEGLMSREVSLQQDTEYGHLVTLAEVNSQRGGFHIDQVQLEGEVGAVLDLQDLDVVCSDGVQPESGVDHLLTVLTTLAAQQGGGRLVVAEEGRGEDLLQEDHQDGEGVDHHQAAGH